MKHLIILLLISVCIFSCSTNNNGTVTIVPLAPTNLTGSVISTTQINLSWTDNATTEDGYKIERKTGTGNYSVIGSTASNMTTFSDLGLTPNTSYTYRVYGYNSAGNSLQYSNEVTLSTQDSIPSWLTNGLVGYWPFNGNANDESGNGNNGTVNGATLTSDRNGGLNNAYDFNGTNNWIDILNTFFDNGWQNYTLNLWFNCNTVNPNSGNTYLNTMPHGGFAWGYDYINNNKIYHFKDSRIQNHSGWDIFSCDLFNANNINLNSWYNVTIVKLDLNYYYYINSTLDKQSSTTINPISQLCGIKIGAIDGNSEFFNGKLDDIRIYNRALSASEVAYLATH